jgi:hypothetical protein
MHQVVTVALTTLIWTSTALAQFVGPGGTIPVVANNPGRKGTFWRSDVHVVNINPTDTSFRLLLLPEIEHGERAFEPQTSDPILIPAGAQITIANVVQSVFGMVDAKGALSVLSTEFFPLVISSRTFTVAQDGGSYGQEVTGVLVTDTGWTSGVRHDSLFRTNIGLYMPFDQVPAVTFVITVFDSNGTVVGSGSLLFSLAGLQQKSLNAFGVDTLLDGYVVITCSDPSLTWFAYVSVVDQVTGDAVYRAAIGRETDLP